MPVVVNKFEKILIRVTGCILGIYTLTILLFSLPFMQRVLANWTANSLSQLFHSKVEIGSMNIGFLNKVIANDVVIYEPSGSKMASIARVGASLDFLALIQGDIVINTAQLFGTKATLYKDTPDSSPNYQFIIDALKSDDTSEPSEISLCINSFIMRHTDITYDVKSQPLTKGIIDNNHLQFHDCGMNLILRCFTNDSLNADIRRLQAKELNSGLAIRDTKLNIVANVNEAQLNDFFLQSHHSTLSIDSLHVEYGKFNENKQFLFGKTTIIGNITPSDFSAFVTELNSFNDPLELETTLSGNNDEVKIDKLSLISQNNDLRFVTNAKILNPLIDSKRVINASVDNLFLSSERVLAIASLFTTDGQQRPFSAVGDINYSGNIQLSNDGIVSDGNLKTDAGMVDYDLTFDNHQYLICTLKADSVQVGKLIDDDKFGSVSFDLAIGADMSSVSQPFPAGKVNGIISNFTYNNYNYKDINIDALSTSSSVEGKLSINDDNLVLASEFEYKDGEEKNIDLTLVLEKFIPHATNLITDHQNENIAFASEAHLRGSNLSNVMGSILVSDFCLSTPSNNYFIDHLSILSKNEGINNQYVLESDFANANIEGKVNLSSLINSFTNQIGRHIPILIKPGNEQNSQFTYALAIKDSPILHHFIDLDFILNKPIHVNGMLDSYNQELTLKLNAPQLTYSGSDYNDIALNCVTSTNSMDIFATLSSFIPTDDEDDEDKTMNIKLKANIHNNKVISDFAFNQQGKNNIQLHLYPTVTLSDSLGAMKTVVSLKQSNSMINDTLWTAEPALVTLYKKSVECHGLRFSNYNSSISVEGCASTNPTDLLVASINNLEIKYILDIINFNSVRFAGKASGTVKLNNLLSETEPDMAANLNVADFTFQEGSFGNANIIAYWNKKNEAIDIKAHFVDHYNHPVALTGETTKTIGMTDVDGWISPSKNDIHLDINTNKTNAAFLHGFLGGVFKQMEGSITGPIALVGPLSDLNLVGKAVANLNLRLRATDVPYHIENDTINLVPYKIELNEATLRDKFGNIGKANAIITHRNFKNFTYAINVDMKGLCAYDETKFNSDKFMATLFADGDVSVIGSDGHPLYINATVTPTRGSVFAYDAATPDAIIGNGFIEFNDRDSLEMQSVAYREDAVVVGDNANQSIDIHSLSEFNSRANDKEDIAADDSVSITKKAKKLYNNDIYVNFNINLTPACEVKLRMDNLEDGYMRTFGYANLNAQWYNKGTFQLFGNYGINSGSYRLYLQDIIFRDLAIQPGSQVEFNGNPFDANIHLLCHHAINSVPLSDLTSTTAFSQNNKVKVNCILDITGKLGNMDFKFDMDLPNVNEEVRQLVRSMINSEEEMNTQMIYLLGVGRFYPNEYARANGGDNSGQAVNSLLSSTISGQINQLLSSVIGNNSNWNFGSSLVTGEKGWEDLDVEGILSGRLFDERLLLNGNFGYRDNALTNQSSFIGDFEVKWKMLEKGYLYLKAYNQTNDRYFTKATINTQGLGISWQIDFEAIRNKINSEATNENKKKKKKNR